MMLGEKAKALDNKFEGSKNQYNLDREISKIFALS